MTNSPMTIICRSRSTARNRAAFLFVHEGRQPAWRVLLSRRTEFGRRRRTQYRRRQRGANERTLAGEILVCGLVRRRHDSGSLSKQALQRYVQGGGSVLIALGPVAAIRPRVPIFDEGITATPLFRPQRRSLPDSRVGGSGHPALSRTNGFEGVKFYQTVKVDPG